MTDRQAWIRAIEIIVSIVAIVVCTCLIVRWYFGSPGVDAHVPVQRQP